MENTIFGYTEGQIAQFGLTFGVGAFILALAYRSYQFTTMDEVADDAEDAKIAQRSATDPASAPDRDASDDPTTGLPTELGEHIDYDDEDLEEAEAEFEAEARAEAAAKADAEARAEKLRRKLAKDDREEDR